MKPKFYALSITLLAISHIVATQPVNDDCSSATVISQTANCAAVPGTTFNATQSIPAITCQGLEGYADDDVWYVFTATTHSPFISVDPSAGFDAVVDLRTSPCDGTTISCADSKGPGGIENIYTYGLLIGVSYYIRIYSYGYGAGNQGDFTVCVFGSLPPPPVNNECFGPVSLMEYPFCDPYPGTTISASQSIEPILCAGATGFSDDDVWYIFTAVTSNPTVTVESYPLFDAVVDLREGPCNGTTIFCADEGGAGFTEKLYAAGLTIGESYLIRVYSFGSDPNSPAEFNICVHETVCLTCPDYDFYIDPGEQWQTHHSSTGSLGCNMYQVNVKEGKEYTFKTGCGDGATADFDTYLELSGLNCDSITSNDNACENNRSAITWVSSFDGSAFLKISGTSYDEFGSYTLSYKITGTVSAPGQSSDFLLPELIKVFPNPANGVFSIDSRLITFSRIMIYDNTGRIIRLIEMKPPAKSYFSDDLQLVPGLYFLAIETNNGRIHKMLEIVK